MTFNQNPLKCGIHEPRICLFYETNYILRVTIEKINISLTFYLQN